MENNNNVSPKPEQKRNHKLMLDNHSLLSVSGIKNVPTFTDKGITVELNAEKLEIGGKDLTVKSLDVEAGTLTVCGYVTSLRYATKQNSVGFIKRLLK